MVVIYHSGPDYSDDNLSMWSEEGECPPCVESLRMGDFSCQCGRHQVCREMTTDPLDGDPRAITTVTLLSA